MRPANRRRCSTWRPAGVCEVSARLASAASAPVLGTVRDTSTETTSINASGAVLDDRPALCDSPAANFAEETDTMNSNNSAAASAAPDPFDPAALPPVAKLRGGLRCQKTAVDGPRQETTEGVVRSRASG